MDNNDTKIEIKFENEDLVDYDTFTNNEDLSENVLETKLLYTTLDCTLSLTTSNVKQESAEETLDVIKDENVMWQCKICWDNFPDEESYNDHIHSSHMQYNELDFKEHKPVLNHSLIVADNKQAFQELNQDSSDSGKVLTLYLPFDENIEEYAATEKKSLDTLQKRDESKYEVTVLNKTASRTRHNKHNTIDTVKILNTTKKPDTINTQSDSSHNAVNIQVENLSNTVIGHILLVEDDKKYVCNVCHKQFEYRCSYAKHMKAHGGEKLYACTFCDYKCKANARLKTHMRVHVGDKPFLCTLCGLRFARKYALTVHLRSHIGDRPYACEFCNRGFTNSFNLAIHRRTHTGEKPFPCHKCDFRSSRKSSLVSHLRTHTGEKPYKCEYCEYKCTNYSGLVSHNRTHTHDRPYSCKLCHFRSASRGGIVSHGKTHTGEKLYSCDLCDFRCAMKNSLARHMETHMPKKRYFNNTSEFKYVSETTASRIRTYKRKK